MKQHINFDILRQNYENDLELVEQEIADLEDKYLRRTKNYGNILNGFHHYLTSKNLSINSETNIKISNQQRIFSLSSMTSPVSNPKKSTNILRKKYKTKLCKQKFQQQKSYQDQFSIDTQISRFGSLNHHPTSTNRCALQSKSEGDSRTISFDQHFHSQDTEIDSEVQMGKPVKKVKVDERRLKNQRNKRKQENKKIQNEGEIESVNEWKKERVQCMVEEKTLEKKPRSNQVMNDYSVESSPVPQSKVEMIDETKENLLERRDNDAMEEQVLQKQSSCDSLQRFIQLAQK